MEDFNNILNMLNGRLSDEDLENRFIFCLTTDGIDDYNISLIEIEYFEYEIVLFRSEDPFDKDIGELYEENTIPYSLALRKQIKRNLLNIIGGLQELRIAID